MSLFGGPSDGAEGSAMSGGFVVKIFPSAAGGGERGGYTTVVGVEGEIHGVGLFSWCFWFWGWDGE